ncbi:MAG: nucleotide exchange factor GrpE [Verrucomicrobia bacterium RIFCSPHIGHO2_12_FULL_41_10]|nr:MAG: nucleotide exchange factor GrpE [Verrucomicrobia bacterium RIFCSPHIGHO2_12_FULL_41_10]
MQTNAPDSIQEIETRIAELQKTHIMLKEQLNTIQSTAERSLDDGVLRIIDILDMISSVKTNININDEANSTISIIVKKIEKRLLDVLRHWKVEEIVLEGRVQPGKTRVLETRPVSKDIAPGTVLQICRKGYQRANKTIRPTDVISAKE